MRYVIALIRMLFASPAWADTRCSANSLGTTSKDSDGRIIKSRTNSLGTTTYTDNKRKTIKAGANYLGAIYTGGTRGTAKTNSLGATTYKDNKYFVII